MTTSLVNITINKILNLIKMKILNQMINCQQLKNYQRNIM